MDAPPMASTLERDGLIACEQQGDWDEFCSTSPEGTPFMMSWFTEIASASAARYLWRENGRTLAAVLVPLCGDTPVRPDFSSHHSVCFTPEIESLQLHRRTERYFSLLSAISGELCRIYKSFHLSLHPKIADVRPLLWHNYGRPEDGNFKVDIRYTATRTLEGFDSIEGLLADIRYDRRTDYRKAVKAHCSIGDGISGKDFVTLYKKTFARQNIGLEPAKLSVVERVVDAIGDGRGYTLVVRNDEGQIVSSTAVLTSRHCAYSLFTANDPDQRRLGANTMLVLEAMIRAKKLGMAIFDFVGANSPNRGDYKLSFNSALRTYYEAEWTAP